MWGWGFRVRVWGLGFRVQGSGFRVQGSGATVDSVVSGTKWVKEIRFIKKGTGTVIVFQGIIKGKGLQALVQILYQILDKTRNVVL